MAVLSDPDRAAEWAAVMAELSREEVPCAVVKSVLRSAVDAADAWIDANAAAYYAALPAALRTWLNAQPAAFRNAFASRLLTRVIERRYTVGA